MTSEYLTPTLLKSDSLGRVETPTDQREALLDLFEQSGLTGAAFTRLHGIRYTTFAHWKRVRRKRRKASEVEQAPAMFQEAVITPSPRQGGEGLPVELPMGTRVVLTNPNQIPLIAALARHLKETASC